MIINRHRFLDRLRLGPRGHPIQQHLFERPDAIRQARRHRWRTGVPHLAEPVPLVVIGSASAWRKLV